MESNERKVVCKVNFGRDSVSKLGAKGQSIGYSSHDIFYGKVKQVWCYNISLSYASFDGKWRAPFPTHLDTTLSFLV